MRLNQVSWTNPLTNKILLEAGVNVNTQLCDFSYHRCVAGHKLPRVLEVGETVGMDDVSARVNTTAGSPTAAVPSAALNNGLGMAAESRDLNNLRTRASLSDRLGGAPHQVTTAGTFPSSDTTRSTTRGRPTAMTGQRRPARPRHRAATPAFPSNPTNTPLGPDGVGVRWTMAGGLFHRE